MNTYTDAIILNCEQYLRKYTGKGKTYDFINAFTYTLIGFVIGYGTGVFS